MGCGTAGWHFSGLDDALVLPKYMHCTKTVNVFCCNAACDIWWAAPRPGRYTRYPVHTDRVPEALTRRPPAALKAVNRRPKRCWPHVRAHGHRRGGGAAGTRPARGGRRGNGAFRFWMPCGHGVALALRACCAGGVLAAHAPGRARAERQEQRRPGLDANSGQILYQSAADEPRHPASLAKMMTLYLVFERHRAGPARLPDQDQDLGQRQRRRPLQARPRAGRRDRAHRCHQGLITKSANDVAVALAEHIAGSEDQLRPPDDREGAPTRHGCDHLPECLRACPTTSR